jgi:hypothetical protein
MSDVYLLVRRKYQFSKDESKSMIGPGRPALFGLVQCIDCPFLTEASPMTRRRALPLTTYVNTPPLKNIIKTQQLVMGLWAPGSYLSLYKSIDG